MRPEEYIRKADIDFKLGVKADKIDPKKKYITLSNGETIVCLLFNGMFYKYLFIDL